MSDEKFDEVSNTCDDDVAASGAPDPRRQRRRRRVVVVRSPRRSRDRSMPESRAAMPAGRRVLRLLLPAADRSMRLSAGYERLSEDEAVHLLPTALLRHRAEDVRVRPAIALPGGDVPRPDDMRLRPARGVHDRRLQRQPLWHGLR